MKNFVQEGDRLTVTAPYDRLSGQGVLVGAMFGVAVYDALSGAALEIVTEGVFDISKAGSLAITAGDRLWWDNSAKNLNKTSTSNYQVAIAVADALSADTTVRCMLMRVPASGS